MDVFDSDFLSHRVAVSERALVRTAVANSLSMTSSECWMTASINRLDDFGSFLVDTHRAKAPSICALQGGQSKITYCE